jgi:hypothetical protein
MVVPFLLFRCRSCAELFYCLKANSFWLWVGWRIEGWLGSVGCVEIWVDEGPDVVCYGYLADLVSEYILL